MRASTGRPCSARRLRDIRGKCLQLGSTIPRTKTYCRPTDVSCQPTVSNLDTSRKYCLILGAKEPAYCEGLRKQKSDSVGVNESEIFWGRPFGTRLHVHQFASQCRLTLTCGLLYSTLLHPMPQAQITITLRQYRRLRSSLDIGTSVVDCSTLRGTQSE